MQHQETARVRNTLVHVIGQNKQLVADALEEIIDVHYRYRNFSALTQEEARQYIANNFKKAKQPQTDEKLQKQKK